MDSEETAEAQCSMPLLCFSTCLVQTPTRKLCKALAASLPARVSKHLQVRAQDLNQHMWLTGSYTLLMAAFTNRGNSSCVLIAYTCSQTSQPMHGL